VEEPLSEFYVTVKIHKTPWATQPIFAQSGSLLHGLGRWVDQQLQPICKKLPTYISSSASLKTKLDDLQVPHAARTRLFTMDAVSMYTNTETDHALEVIATYLRSNPECYNADAIIDGLAIVMRHCLFKFGDTYWHQIDRTAMGAPPAPSYATLYYGIHEINTLLPVFGPNLALHVRYIDDGFGIWICHDNVTTDDALWQDFQDSSKFGKLRWTFSDRQQSVPFLGIRITLQPNGRLRTKQYEKELHLYLYLPPHSAHPPGLLKGLIAGMIYRILRLTTDAADIRTDIQNRYNRLRRRGYSCDTLSPLFADAYNNVYKKLHNHTTVDPTATTTENRIFLHIPYNQLDPSRRRLQALFHHHLNHPKNERQLHDLKNFEGYYCPTRRLVIAYHKQLNIKNVLFPRRFRKITGRQVSSFLPPPEEVPPEPPDPHNCNHKVLHSTALCPPQPVRGRPVPIQPNLQLF
jgi:hypothetical protein